MGPFGGLNHTIQTRGVFSVFDRMIVRHASRYKPIRMAHYHFDVKTFCFIISLNFLY